MFKLIVRYAVIALIGGAGFGLAPMKTMAGEADIIDVKVVKKSGNLYRFDVTLRHGDTGWKHYANAFEVVGPDGKVLGKRVLHHPHVHEQPFTRSLSGVKIPAGVKKVTLRALDSVHETGGREMLVNLPQ